MTQILKEFQVLTREDECCFLVSLWGADGYRPLALTVDQYHFGHGGPEPPPPLLETHFHIKTQRTGDVTQPVKCLLSKHENVSFISKTHILNKNPDVLVYACNPHA